MARSCPLWAVMFVFLTLIPHLVAACGYINELPTPTLVIRATPTSTPTPTGITRILSHPKDVKLSDIAYLPGYISSLSEQLVPQPRPTSASDWVHAVASRSYVVGQAAVSALHDIEPKAVLEDVGRFAYKSVERARTYQYVRIVDAVASLLGLGPAPTKTTKPELVPTRTNATRLPKHTPAVETITNEEEEERMAGQPLFLQLAHSLLADRKDTDKGALAIDRSPGETPSLRLLGKGEGEGLVAPSQGETACALFIVALVLAGIWLRGQRTTMVHLTFKLEVNAIRPGFPFMRFVHISHASTDGCGEVEKGAKERVEEEANKLLEKLVEKYSGVRVSVVTASFVTTRRVYVLDGKTEEVLDESTSTSEVERVMYFSLDGESGVSDGGENMASGPFLGLPAPFDCEQDGKWGVVRHEAVEREVFVCDHFGGTADTRTNTDTIMPVPIPTTTAALLCQLFVRLDPGQPTRPRLLLEYHRDTQQPSKAVGQQVQIETIRRTPLPASRRKEAFELALAKTSAHAINESVRAVMYTTLVHYLFSAVVYFSPYPATRMGVHLSSFASVLRPALPIPRDTRPQKPVRARLLIEYIQKDMSKLSGDNKVEARTPPSVGRKPRREPRILQYVTPALRHGRLEELKEEREAARKKMLEKATLDAQPEREEGAMNGPTAPDGVWMRGLEPGEEAEAEQQQKEVVEERSEGTGGRRKTRRAKKKVGQSQFEPQPYPGL